MTAPSVAILFVLGMLGSVVVAQFDIGKPGDCPPPTGVGICADTCYADNQCAGAAKCCPTACGGTICTMPVTMRREVTRGEKPGYCPARPSGPWVCSSTCVFDGDCRGRLKCCKNRCGAMACIKPEV
ncbi:hypothetical protein CBL_05592 [Carabus blaptoides fortunei]